MSRKPVKKQETKEEFAPVEDLNEWGITLEENESDGFNSTNVKTEKVVETDNVSLEDLQKQFGSLFNKNK